jgi:hypothetical protein
VFEDRDSVAAVNASSPAPRCRLRCTPRTLPPAAKTCVMYGSPAAERSAIPKHTPTPLVPDARASAATAGWPNGTNRSRRVAGSTDPVSDISGNNASSHPAEAAASSSRR